ncbi:hypothetical protein DDZ16_13805 [Marinilabilia rubra]|uniref:Uncharacterized protein n=2 Tax=Marinilabilia rubra TaxID=2162893 RepID=A0A2U2B6V5_9BACT|nr:hypothetical protein DDZ16_13805 [Marinilabilia rubra]
MVMILLWIFLKKRRHQRPSFLKNKKTKKLSVMENEELGAIRKKGRTTEVKGIQKYQVLRLQVAEAGQTQTLNTNTKQEHDRITGVFINVDQQNALVGSLLDLSIDDTEIIPEGFEAVLINRTVGVSINQMPYEFEVRARNSKIKLNYKDGAAPGAIYPYTVSVYLRAIDY